MAMNEDRLEKLKWSDKHSKIRSGYSRSSHQKATPLIILIAIVIIVIRPGNNEY